MLELIVGRQYVTAAGRIVTALEVLPTEATYPEQYICVDRDELGHTGRDAGRNVYFYAKDRYGETGIDKLCLLAMLPEHLTGAVVPETVELCLTASDDFRIDEDGFYVTRDGMVVYVYNNGYGSDGTEWVTRDSRVAGSGYRDWWYYSSNGSSNMGEPFPADLVDKYTPTEFRTSATSPSYMYDLPKEFKLGEFNSRIFRMALQDPDATVEQTQSDYNSRTHTSLWAWNPETKTYREFIVCKEYVSNKDKVEDNRSRRSIGWQMTYNILTNYHMLIDSYVNNMCYNRRFTRLPSGMPVKHGTGAHTSREHPDMVAVYPTLRAIQTKRAVVMRPGKYLTKYYPWLSADEVRVMSAKMSLGDLRFFKDWKDMYDMYYALDESGIVGSCMSKHVSRWAPVNPLMVYDNSDVELAVLFINDKPVARALYNKQNKHYPMIYGQWEKMQVVLERNGFKHGSLDGARINRLRRYPEKGKELETYEGTDDLLIAYIDHKRALDRSEVCSSQVNDMGDHLVIEYGGQYNANDYEYVRLRLDGSDDNHEDDDSYFSCECCGDRTHEDDGHYIECGGITVCDSCWDSEVVEFRTTGYRNATATDYATRDYCRDNFVLVNGYWYDNEESLEAWGYVYCANDDIWYKEDYVVWVEEAGEYYHVDDIGYVIQAIDGGEIYATSEYIADNLDEFYLNPEATNKYNVFFSSDNEGQYVSLESLPTAESDLHPSYMYEERPELIDKHIWETIWKDHKPQPQQTQQSEAA